MIGKIAVALDFDVPAQALNLAAKLKETGCVLKVGLELYARTGLDLVNELGEQGFTIFLDLKLCDIPNTVERTLKVLVKSQAHILNVHCLGGYEMLARAAAVCHSAGKKLLGVTVLTSLGQNDLSELGLGGDTPEELVVRLALLAQKAGLDGVVCSAREVSRLRRELGPEFLLFTPGIRAAGSATQDQERVMTPHEALAAGSSCLVIGRPITGAADPLAAYYNFAKSKA
jgi:orotidine-5'-phosphate decarboxylase